MRALPRVLTLVQVAHSLPLPLLKVLVTLTPSKSTHVLAQRLVAPVSRIAVI